MPQGLDYNGDTVVNGDPVWLKAGVISIVVGVAITLSISTIGQLEDNAEKKWGIPQTRSALID